MAQDFDNVLMPLEIHRVIQGDSNELLQAVTTSRKKVVARDNWTKFQAAEVKQLDKNIGHDLYGEPTLRRNMPVGASVCHQIWSYIKPNGKYKAHDCLNGKQLTRMGTLYSNTFNICVTWMPAALVFFIICAIKNYVIRAYDMVNAFMEAEPPCDSLFVVVDQYMLDYFRDRLNKHIPVGWIVPILKSLQGHPETGRIFDKAVNESKR